MLTYILQRIAVSILVCLTSMCLLFAALHAIPGDPATIVLGSRATPEVRERLNHELGLDKPLLFQFSSLIGNVVQGNFGTDIFSKRSVGEEILENLPSTLILIGAGLGWAALLAVPLGCFSALKRGTWIDRLTGILSVGTISIPSFVVAIYALLLLSVQLGWFPVIGAGENGNIRDQLWHLVLPSFSVGVGWVGYLARIVRASMLEVMDENHIRTARAFGLPESKIVLHYALRIAILPTVTLLGLAIGGLLSSAVFAENIFARPGIGKLIVDAANVRNYPVVQGAVLSTVALFAFAMPISDLIIAWLDPRVRTAI
ncbi:putative peptide transporter permease subunit: membrane component of ABC superfamily [Mesorhizobium plurifarium]|uniref:Putative peptide transporter permease subunit: membrane component of ABC superfamily n=1 Tax=Mesorhizobium plurifarium TaxID=69974 RepID=A0A090FZ97_MESPL|nr:putative peptide transporter permease subunit: membrane component of ABC superfamily [Mesorhizobium plurifarium]